MIVWKNHEQKGPQGSFSKMFHPVDYEAQWTTKEQLIRNPNCVEIAS